MIFRKFIMFAFISLFFGCNSSILDDPSTTISYSIPQRAHVKMVVENSYGTLIATIVDEEMDAGKHAVSFNSNNLAEGLYYYILEVRGLDDDSYNKTIKKMLLVKP
jgi:hypothetical protein